MLVHHNTQGNSFGPWMSIQTSMITRASWEIIQRRMPIETSLGRREVYCRKKTSMEHEQPNLGDNSGVHATHSKLKFRSGHLMDAVCG